METKYFLIVGLILTPFVLTERQCTENGQRNVEAHIENVVDEVCIMCTGCLDKFGISEL